MTKVNITRQFMIFLGFFLVLCGVLLMSYYFIKMYPEQSARKLLIQAVSSYERGDKESINKSLDVLTIIVSQYENTNSAISAYYYMGLCYEKLGLNHLAYEKYYSVFRNYTNLPDKTKRELQIKLSRLKILRQQTEEGVDQLLALINNSTDHEFRSRIYTELGHAYIKMKVLEKAVRMFDIALSENGRNQDAILGKALALKKLGYDNKAYDMYEHYLKFYAHYNTYAKSLRNTFLQQVEQSGYTSFKKGEYANCISFYSRLIRNFPDNKKTENAYFWIGRSYIALRNYDAAIRFFNKSLSNKYHHLDQNALIKRGYAQFLAKRFELAARDFQIYLDKYPKGTYNKLAQKWKDISTKEILYRIEMKNSNNDSMNLKDEFDRDSSKSSGETDFTIDDTINRKDNEETVSEERDSQKSVEF